jgi:hypothetical protein
MLIFDKTTHFTGKECVTMKFSYYPGCTLRNKAKELDAYARASAKALPREMPISSTL